MRYPHHHSSRVSDIADALVTAPRLITLILKHPQYSRDFLARVAQNPLLQLIRVVFQPTDHGLNVGVTLKKSRQFETSLEQDDRLKKLLSYEYPAREVDSLPDGDGAELFRDSLPSFSGSFVAFRTTPEEVKRMIWSNIIYFTLLRDRHLDNASIYESFNHIGPEHINKVWRVNILLVCKLFRKMARQHFYRCRILAPRVGLRLLADRVQDDPSLGSHLRSLITQSHFSKPEHFRMILSHATGLVHLKSPFNPLAVFLPGKSWRHRRQAPLLDFRGLEALSHAAGSTLETLTGQVLIRPSTPKPPTVLYAFTALRTLEWESSAQVKFKPNEVPVDALATLEALSCTSVNGTFLSLLCCMSLPVLQHVAFPNSSKMEGAHKFLQKHGSKIITLKTENSKGLLALCPALTVLYLSGDSWFETHRTLTKIVIAKVRSFKETIAKTDLKYFGQVGFRTRYPALQEIQVYYCTWPTTEREITKGSRANWVLWSEHLMTWNIKLMDGTGKHWRPRLK